MALTREQRAQLEALQAAENAPPHRTREGIAGVLHALIESARGAVPHRSPEEWDAMAETVEDEHGTPESGDEPAAGDGEDHGQDAGE